MRSLEYNEVLYFFLVVRLNVAFSCFILNHFFVLSWGSSMCVRGCAPLFAGMLSWPSESCVIAGLLLLSLMGNDTFAN